jgi:hypothetical protein
MKCYTACCSSARSELRPKGNKFGIEQLTRILYTAVVRRSPSLQSAMEHPIATHCFA